MKFIYTSIFCVASSVSASGIPEFFESGALGQVAFQDSNDPRLLDAMRTIAQTDMANINNYGCWCYFEGNHGKGKGVPIDDIDAICRVLHDGYSCILLDSEAAGQSCIPWEIPYNSAVGSGIPALGMTEENLIQECDNQNAVGTCENWTCKVEGFFIRSLLLHFTQGGHGVNQSHRHSQGFSVSDSCPTAGNNPQTERECCGDYPRRRTFKPQGLNGTKGCCNGNTFNASLLQCCDDGTTAITC